MKSLRCYASGRPGEWEAFCLDFDLAVQGRSFEEVYRSLKVAIDDYVAAVAALPEPNRRRLLNRRAPLHARLGFLVALLYGAVRPRGPGNDERHGYTLPCAA